MTPGYDDLIVPFVYSEATAGSGIEVTLYDEFQSVALGTRGWSIDQGYWSYDGAGSQCLFISPASEAFLQSVAHPASLPLEWRYVGYYGTVIVTIDVSQAGTVYHYLTSGLPQTPYLPDFTPQPAPPPASNRRYRWPRRRPRLINT